jgi:hypothetical protein
MSDTDKVRENRVRRAAQRQGLALMKSRRRDERALDYGMYMLVNVEINATVFSTPHWVDLDDVEEYLNK